jgi:hypothetical protein
VTLKLSQFAPPLHLLCASAQWINVHRSFPGGSKEQAMTNLSFARIMYGTSEDSQHSTSMNASALSALSTLSSNGTEENATESETLGELLHRAWMNLSRK